MDFPLISHWFLNNIKESLVPTATHLQLLLMASVVLQSWAQATTALLQRKASKFGTNLQSASATSFWQHCLEVHCLQGAWQVLSKECSLAGRFLFTMLRNIRQQPINAAMCWWNGWSKFCLVSKLHLMFETFAKAMKHKGEKHYNFAQSATSETIAKPFCLKQFIMSHCWHMDLKLTA